MAHLTFRGLAALPITQWLMHWAEGDAQAAEKLIVQLLPLLERAARSAIRGNPAAAEGLSLHDLVGEVWLRITPKCRTQYPDREAFYAAAMRQMRFVLIDRYRRSLLGPTPGVEAGPIESGSERLGAQMDVQLAVRALSSRYPRQAQTLLLSKLLGMAQDEVAATLGIAIATVKRDLCFAEAEIARLLGSDS